VSAEHAALVAGAALLEQGRRVDALSHGVTWAALLTGVIALGFGGRGAHGFAAMAAAAVLVGLVELWFAARVDLDAQLFRHLAAEAGAGRLDLARFDAGLHLAGLIPAPTATRGIGARIAGARRLLGAQAAVCALQLMLMAAAGAIAWRQA